jgi:predicted glycogen debranching enzyme
MRNRLSALASQCGAFGFTSGVEWLCTHKIDVHEARPLGWNDAPNLLRELGRLNALLRDHPCFFDGASVRRLSPDDSAILALARSSAEGLDHCLVLINLDVEQAHELALSAQDWGLGGDKNLDLLGQPAPAPEWQDDGSLLLSLAPGQSFCLASHLAPRGLSGEAYRARRAQAAWAYTQLGACLPHESLGAVDFVALGGFAAEDPQGFLAVASHLSAEHAQGDLYAALLAARQALDYRPVVTFRAADSRRITLVPPEHWLLVWDEEPFEIEVRDGERTLHRRSVAMDAGHVVALAPEPCREERELYVRLDRFCEPGPPVQATLRRLATTPRCRDHGKRGLVLLTNGRGAMARLHADFGAVHSKYDCLLAANLHAEVPSERWVLVKRVRAWVNADGFVTPLDGANLSALSGGSPARWTFAANAGADRRVGVSIDACFVGEHNCVALQLRRVAAGARELPDSANVQVILRFELEDRSMHGETVATPELQEHFARTTRPLPGQVGFAFTPAPERRVHVRATRGSYHEGSEWSFGIRHDVEENRGMAARGDAFSPGWFELPLLAGQEVTLFVDAEPEVRDKPAPNFASAGAEPPAATPGALGEAALAERFERALREAARAFVVRRGRGKTVIAGYPWFLDWGRDTLIAARGLVSAGYHEDVREILLTFAEFERGGSLPNYLAGAGEGSRETSDAPLWFGLACEELARAVGPALYREQTASGRSLAEVLGSIAEGYLRGTEQGVHVDAESGLVWSPPHFTWMDTNYPAATPREGYPIELSVLYARLLRQVARIDPTRRARFEALAQRTEQSVLGFYRPELGYCADTLHAPSGVPAQKARPDDHLRPNQLLAVSLGLLTGEPARQVVSAVERYLLVPGALRSLAPRPVSYGLPVRSADGRALNDPAQPYWGHYEGDEDTRRKPAYHNGTAWGWWLPSYCEALALAYAGDARARGAARAVLGSTARLLSEGCLGQLPEILDGDAPHWQRGCDAQAWSATEALRVWLWLAGAAA